MKTKWNKVNIKESPNPYKRLLSEEKKAPHTFLQSDINYLFSYAYPEHESAYAENNYLAIIRVTNILETQNFENTVYEDLIASEHEHLLEQMMRIRKIPVEHKIRIVQQEREKGRVHRAAEYFVAGMRSTSYPQSFLIDELTNDALNYEFFHFEMFFNNTSSHTAINEYVFSKTDNDVQQFEKFLKEAQRPIHSHLKRKQFKDLNLDDLYRIADKLDKAEFYQFAELGYFYEWISEPSEFSSFSHNKTPYKNKFTEAAKETLSDKRIEELMNDEENSRLALAFNSGLPAEIFEELADDESIEVQRAVVMNPNVPSKVLETLSESRDLLTRILVAANKKTNKETLLRMLQKIDNTHEKEKQLETEIMMNANFPVEKIRQKFNEAETMYKKGENKEENLELMRLLTQSEAWEFTDFSKFAEIKDEIIRFNLLVHPATPKVLKNLLKA